MVGLGSYGLSWSMGIPGYPVDSPLTIEGFVDLAAELGYDGIQIADNTPLIDLDREKRARLKDRADSHNLFIEVGGRGLTLENLDRHLEVCQDLDAELLRFVIDGPDFEPDRAMIADLLAEAARRCADAGIPLAIENHDRFEADCFLDWIHAVDSAYLGICLDSVNSYGCGESSRSTIDTLLPATINFHLKDFSIRRQPHMLGFLIEGTPAGEGMLALPEILRRLHAIGRCKAIIVEHWTPLTETPEASARTERDWCLKSLLNLRRLMGSPV
jgi:sugar phosphate isomerase/epimerase